MIIGKMPMTDKKGAIQLRVAPLEFYIFRLS